MNSQVREYFSFREHARDSNQRVIFVRRCGGQSFLSIRIPRLTRCSSNRPCETMRVGTIRMAQSCQIASREFVLKTTSVVTMPFMPISAPAEQSPLYAPMTSWFQSISSHFCILWQHVFVPLMMLFDEIACVCETEERHFSFFESDRDINFSKSSTSTPWLPHHVGVLMCRFPALSYSGSECDSSALFSDGIAFAVKGS